MSGKKTCEQILELIVFKQTLSDKNFVGKIENKKLICNHKFMLFTFDEKVLQFFQDKMAIKIWIDFLANFLTWFTKKLFSIYQFNCCMKFIPFGKLLICMPSGNYVIWDVIINSSVEKKKKILLDVHWQFFKGSV